jgi:hypothetical protein
VGDSGRVTLQNAAAATGNGTVMNVDGFKAVYVQITGTFVGTVTFETSLDGTNWVATGGAAVATGTLASAPTAPGAWTITTNGVNLFRARVSAYTSGNITVLAKGSRL